ncbi:MAG: hypothetical protein ACREOH_16395 [Candidatus Entotheonellia bacterium]
MSTGTTLSHRIHGLLAPDHCVMTLIDHQPQWSMARSHPSFWWPWGPLQGQRAAK